MTFGAINITIDGDLLRLADEYTSQARDIFDEVGLELVDDLQRRSPVGATKGLKSGWDLVQSTRQRNTLDLRFRIVNNADAAEFRAIGRQPGRFPPFDEGSALDKWVKVKLGISDEKRRKAVRFLIARKIAREGTDRYKSGDNILGLDYETREYLPDSPVLKARQEAIDRLNAIQLPKRR